MGFARRAKAAFILAIGLWNWSASADSPSWTGSRYDNWQNAAKWTSYFGINSHGTGNDNYLWSDTYRLLGDVNGDGLADIVGFNDNGVFVGISTGSSFAGDAQWTTGMSLFVPNAEFVVTSPRFVADMNHDGLADVVAIGKTGVWVGLSDGRSSFGVSEWGRDFGEKSAISWNPKTSYRTLADVTGDGIPDVVGFMNNTVYVAVASPSSKSFNAMTQWGTFSLKLSSVPRLYDMNGDGKADIVAFENTGTYIAYSQGDHFGAAHQITTQFGSGWTDSDSFREIADVNGDGHPDVFGLGEYGAGIAVAPATSGGTWGYSSISHGFAHYGSVKNNIIRLKDVNGDGKADFVSIDKKGVSVALAWGDGTSVKFLSPALWVDDFGSGRGWSRVQNPRLLDDVNGDGRPDIVGFGQDGVYVSPSSSLYCCDFLQFRDPVANKTVTSSLYARAYLPRSKIVMPLAADSNSGCQAGYRNALHPIGAISSFPPNSRDDNKVPWGSLAAYRGTRLMMNANFYDLAAGNPYLASVPCTTALGYAVSAGSIVAPYSDVHDTPTQMMGFLATPGPLGPYAAIGPASATETPLPTYNYAISGFQLVSQGQAVAQPGALDPNDALPRSAIGLTKDGNTIIMLTVNNGDNEDGVTLPALAQEMIALGAYSALNLDGSGSAQMMFSNGEAIYMSLGSDSWDGESHLHRPVPVFFGVQ